LQILNYLVVGPETGPSGGGIWGVSPSLTDPVLSASYGPDNNVDRLSILASGMIQWGLGGSTPVGTNNLYMLTSAPGYYPLVTDGFFWSKKGIYASSATGTDGVLGTFIVGDANDRFEARADGQLQWGPGGSGAIDTFLYRTGAGVLQTSGGFVAVSNFQSLASGSGVAGIYVTNLASNGFFAAVRQGTDTSGWRLTIDANGVMNWGPGGGAATDTNLYRSGAAALKTDSSLTAATIAVTGAKPNWAVPAAGTTGQALVKNSNTDYDTKWAAVGGMTLIQEQILGAATAAVTFSSIPTTYRMLLVLIAKANSNQSGQQTLYMRFNNDAGGTNYGNNQQGFRSEIPVGTLPGTAMGAFYLTGKIEVPYPNLGSWIFANIATISRSNNAGTTADISVIQYPTIWFGAAAVNRIDLITLTGSINAGAAFALYGIT
jgi:hypothetical protein